MGLMNTPAMRAHVMGLGPFLSVSMTSYEVSGGGGACLLSENRISGFNNRY